MNTPQLTNLLESLKEDVIHREELSHLNAVNENSHFLSGTIRKEDEPADASYKSIINNGQGQPVAFLICSNPVNTGLVSRNVEKARQAAKVLGKRSSAMIQMPILEGAYNQLSWAVFSIKRPLSDNKWQWRWQKVMLTQHLANWLTDVIHDSMKKIEAEDIEDAVVSPLQDLAEDVQFPTDIRKTSEKVIKRLVSGVFNPKSILAHNDLWKGNVMLPSHSDRRESNQRFYIIDWAGSSTKGFAFFDLVKLAESLKFPAFFFRRIIVKHCNILECDIEDAMSYLLAAIACLGRNLEYFPRHRYIEMSVGLYRKLSEITD